MKITQGAISDQARDSKMPAVEEEEDGGVKRDLISPLKRKVEEGGIKRALVSPSKRRTGGIIEMWITDESYTSPVKETKVLESLDLADDLNLDEEKVEKEEKEEMLNSTVDSSFSSSVNDDSELLQSSVNISDLLESSTDPDVEIKEVELGDESVGAGDDEPCEVLPSDIRSKDKATLSSDTGGQRFSKEEGEEGQHAFRDLKVKDDNGEHETKAKTEEGEDEQKLERTEEKWGTSVKNSHNEQGKHEESSGKDNVKIDEDHKVPVEDRKMPIEVVDLDSDEEEEEQETIHPNAGGSTVR